MVHARLETLYKRYVASTKSQELVLRLAILSMIYLWAFSIRLVGLSLNVTMMYPKFTHSWITVRHDPGVC